MLKIGISFLILGQLYSQTAFMVEVEDQKKVGLLLSNRIQFLDKTNSSDWALYPALSPSGEEIAFAEGKGQDDLRIVLLNLKTHKREFISMPGVSLHPHVTTNHIAYSYNGQIVVYDKRSRVFNVMANGYKSYFPQLFQEADRIVYQRNDSSLKQIVIKNLLTDKELVIGEGMSPALSKDELFIAYTFKDADQRNLRIYNRLTKETIQLESSSESRYAPTFDRYNNLVYSHYNGDNFEIKKISFGNWQKQDVRSTRVARIAGSDLYAPSVAGLALNMSQHAAFKAEPRSSFATVECEGMVYMMGGHKGAEHTYPKESFSDEVFRYDPKSNEWKQLASKIYPAHGNQAVCFEGSIYVFGGFAYDDSYTPKWKSINVVEKYSIKNNSWSLATQMPRNRSSYVLGHVKNKVYFLGGWDATPKFIDDIDGTFWNEVDVYDLEQDRWETLESKLPVKRRALGGFTHQDKIYMTGGISEGGHSFSLSKDFTQFNPDSHQFTRLADLPFGTFAPAASSYGDYAYMFGGMFKLSKWNYEYVPHIYRYDFMTNQWSHTGRYLNENKGFSQIAKHASCIYIFGGHSYRDNKDAPLATTESLCF